MQYISSSPHFLTPIEHPTCSKDTILSLVELVLLMIRRKVQNPAAFTNQMGKTTHLTSHRVYFGVITSEFSMVRTKTKTQHHTQTDNTSFLSTMLSSCIPHSPGIIHILKNVHTSMQLYIIQFTSKHLGNYDGKKLHCKSITCEHKI